MTTKNNYDFDFLTLRKLYCYRNSNVNILPYYILTQTPTGEAKWDNPLSNLSSIGIALPIGTCYSDYMYWNSYSNAWATGESNVHLGCGAGESNQGTKAVALGYNSGQVNQGDFSIGIGVGSGNFNQSSNAISIGTYAGYTRQYHNSIAIGSNAGYTDQSANSIAIGLGAGYSSQATGCIAIGENAASDTQKDNSIAIGNSAGKLNQGYFTVAIGNGAGYGTQSDRAIAIGTSAGNSSQGNSSVAIGDGAGSSQQSTFSVAIGPYAGASYQNDGAVAIGDNAGYTSQSRKSIAIGAYAGYDSQQTRGIAIGDSAGYEFQSSFAIAIGNNAGSSGQKSGAIAIGKEASIMNQGTNSIAIGFSAVNNNQNDGSIALNATGTALTVSTAGFYVDPIREDNDDSEFLTYITGSREVIRNRFLTLVNQNIQSLTNIIPGDPGEYDLGTSAMPWRSGYFSSNTVYIGTGKINATSTGNHLLLNKDNGGYVGINKSTAPSYNLDVNGAINGSSYKFVGGGGTMTLAPRESGDPSISITNGTNTGYIYDSFFNLPVPIGTILMYGGSGASAPSGWLECYGQYVSIASYPALYGIIGTTYGSASGQFRLPDLTGRVPIGTGGGYSRGSEGGSKEIALGISQLPRHNHDIDDPGHSHAFVLKDGATTTGDAADGADGSASGKFGNTNSATTGISVKETGSGLPFSIMQPYLVITYIIKSSY